ncbi:hypothetical protein [Streptomyces djakartensis]|uniref:Uncharacterized protein n=1 Tax=Streptomyces djakartensis TaxID=68193 RepID=A0ABQ2Z896_9ACTN|nr:hypothetical protein [Streptomyces djakartensis]GGY05756.1 hypothetical protein GCM10010384_07360 [Streptomyces djakartensis]
MSQDKEPTHSGKRDERPETALGEVLREIEDAENRTRDTAEQRRRRGEAGEAITPNTRAQEESEGEPKRD